MAELRAEQRAAKTVAWRAVMTVAMRAERRAAW